MAKAFTTISNLSKEDVNAVLTEFNAKEKSEILVANVVASFVFILWSLFDYYYAPTLWVLFLMVRIGITIPYLVFSILVYRGIWPYNFLVKLVNSTPAPLFVIWQITLIPDVSFVYYISSLVLIVLATGSSKAWHPLEFVSLAAIVYITAAVVWGVDTKFRTHELFFMHFIFVAALLAAFGAAASRYLAALHLFANKKQLLAAERKQFENHLAESARTAYLAEHLALFLHEVKNILFHVELVSEATETNPDKVQDFLEGLKRSSTFTRQKIESFLSHVKSGKREKKVVSIGSELHAVEQLARFEVENRGIPFVFDCDEGAMELRVFAVPGALPSIVFNMIKNSIAAIETRAQTQKQGKNVYVGAIQLTVERERDTVSISVRDNGETMDERLLQSFRDGEILESTHEGRAGLGTKAMRIEAEASGFTVELAPGSGAGTVGTVTIPTLVFESLHNAISERA